MKFVVTTFWVILSCIQVFAQGDIKSDYYSNFTPSQPKSSALGAFGNVPVNYYTGQPEVSLNLMTLSSRELSLPVSLNYDASGVRTDEIASSVGLKWQLNAGGYVTRDLNGLPDEHPTKGYFKYAAETDYYANVDNGAWVNGTQKNELDSGPDEFVINIQGRSIKFVFDKYRGRITLPHQDVLINYSVVNNQIDKFEVTTEDGTKYIFGGTASSVEQRKIESLSLTLRIFGIYGFEDPLFGGNWSYCTGEGSYQPVFTPKESVIQPYNSKWHLVKIVSPSGDHIDFNYTKSADDIKYASTPVVTRIVPSLVLFDKYTSSNGWVYPSQQYPSTTWRAFYAFRKFPRTAPGSDPSQLPVDVALTNQQNVPNFFYVPHFSPEVGNIKSNMGGAFANHSLISENAIRLESIVAANGNSIHLTPSSRDDLPNGFKYDYMEMRNMSGQVVKAIQLNFATVDALDLTDYFWVSEAIMMFTISGLPDDGTYYAKDARDRSETDIPDLKLRKYVYEGVKAYNYKRLFLESIDEIGRNGSRIRLYGFEYKDRWNLRRRTTPLKDGLGFTRDLVAEENYKPTNDYERVAKVSNGKSPAAGSKTILGSNDTNASLGRAPDRGILSKIIYTSGGYTAFTYDDNTIGPKIKVVQDYDENDNVVHEKEIEYLKAQESCTPVFISYQDYKMSGSNDWMKYKVESSSPQNNLSFTKGAAEGNKKVKVYAGRKGDGNHTGWEIYSYTSPRGSEVENGVPEDIYITHGDENIYDFKDKNTLVFASPYDLREDGSEIDTGISTDIYPFPRKLDRDHLRGLLRLVEVFDKNGKPVKTIKNYYRLNPNGFQPKIVRGFTGGSFAWTSTSSADFWYGSVQNPQYRLRYGKYEIISEYVVLERTNEVTYDQEDVNKTIGKTTQYTYDPDHLLPVETVTYLDSDPGQKTISKTKYVVHDDYNYFNAANCETDYAGCASECALEQDPQARDACYMNCEEARILCYSNAQFPNPPDARAIVELRNRHQYTSPVEIQNFWEEDNTRKLVSAVAYKYQKQGSPEFIKPKEVWGLKRILNTTGTDKYNESVVDEQTGEFRIDERMRKLHSYDLYDQTNANILQQTTLDGTISTYQWGANASLVYGLTVNPGSQQQTFAYQHYPGVGVTKITDQNQRESNFEYDQFNRLRITRDHDLNIVSRNRYNYKGQSELENQLSISGSSITGQPLTFESPDQVDLGQTQYTWSFGDGATATTSAASGSINHAYTTPGTYTVHVNKTNSEYTPLTVYGTVTVYAPLSVDLNLTGIFYINQCAGNSGYTPPLLTAEASGGCPTDTYTYDWQYSLNGGEWTSLASTFETGPPIGFQICGGALGTYQIRCTVKDACFNTVVGTLIPSLMVTKSSPSCLCGQFPEN